MFRGESIFVPEVFKFLDFEHNIKLEAIREYIVVGERLKMRLISKFAANLFSIRYAERFKRVEEDILLCDSIDGNIKDKVAFFFPQVLSSERLKSLKWHDLIMDQLDMNYILPEGAAQLMGAFSRFLPVVINYIMDDESITVLNRLAFLQQYMATIKRIKRHDFGRRQIKKIKDVLRPALQLAKLRSLMIGCRCRMDKLIMMMANYNLCWSNKRFRIFDVFINKYDDFHVCECVSENRRKEMKLKDVAFHFKYYETLYYAKDDYIKKSFIDEIGGDLPDNFLK